MDPPSIPPPIRILVVDDHAIVRTGLISLLQAQADMIVVGEAENGEEAVASFRTLSPDITLMDLQMPGSGGLQATADIRAAFPDASIIVLTTYSGDILASKALKAGAAGYLLKTALRTELVHAVRAVHSGQRQLSTEVAHDIAIHAADDSLSPREITILHQLSAGAANKVIARNLSITEQTVKWHLKSIFAKLGASDRTDAVLKAGRRGVFDL